jgi:type II secretory pathway pseudopilin PulG
LTRAPRATQKAAQQADQAADQLLDWLRRQRGGVFDETPAVIKPDALLTADRTVVIETAPPSANSSLGDEDYPKDVPTVPEAVAAADFDGQDFSNASRGVPSPGGPVGAIEAAAALAQAGVESVGEPSFFGNPAAGVAAVTCPVLVPAGADEGPKEPSWRDRNGVTGNARCLPHTDWLHHRLDVTGPTAMGAEFQAAARGAGIIPWPFERDRIEEDLFHLLVAPPAPQRRRLSLAGARVLARQLGEAAEARHAAAMARVGHSRACPFDLHALLPVPSDILLLGPDHPGSLAWLWAHWGTTQALRHVVREPALPLRYQRPGGTASLRFSFWSADWTPWRALDAMAARWPTLRFDVAPTYGPL